MQDDGGPADRTGGAGGAAAPAGAPDVLAGGPPDKHRGPGRRRRVTALLVTAVLVAVGLFAVGLVAARYTAGHRTAGAAAPRPRASGASVADAAAQPRITVDAVTGEPQFRRTRVDLDIALLSDVPARLEGLAGVPVDFRLLAIATGTVLDDPLPSTTTLEPPVVLPPNHHTLHVAAWFERTGCPALNDVETTLTLRVLTGDPAHAVPHAVTVPVAGDARSSPFRPPSPGCRLQLRSYGEQSQPQLTGTGSRTLMVQLRGQVDLEFACDGPGEATALLAGGGSAVLCDGSEFEASWPAPHAGSSPLRVQAPAGTAWVARVSNDVSVGG